MNEGHQASNASAVGARIPLALREQRGMGLPGNLYHQTQVQMAYNSNRIEGSKLSADQTRYLYETRTIEGSALADDVIETSNHFRAFNLVIDRFGSPITKNSIREYHRILKSSTSDEDKKWFRVGEWKSMPNMVGNELTTPPEEVDAAIGTLLANTPKKMTFEDVCEFHVRFEQIHPFQDGNGRVGRLIMFEQCLTNGIVPFVVLDSQKMFYYRGLNKYDEQPGFLRETLRHFQDLYEEQARTLLPGG